MTAPVTHERVFEIFYRQIQSIRSPLLPIRHRFAIESMIDNAPRHSVVFRIPRQKPRLRTRVKPARGAGNDLVRPAAHALELAELETRFCELGQDFHGQGSGSPVAGVAAEAPAELVGVDGGLDLRECGFVFVTGELEVVGVQRFVAFGGAFSCYFQ